MSRVEGILSRVEGKMSRVEDSFFTFFLGLVARFPAFLEFTEKPVCNTHFLFSAPLISFTCLGNVGV